MLFVQIRWIFFVTYKNPARSFVLLYFRDHFTIECQTLNFVKIVSVLIFAQWLVKKVGVDGSWLFSFSPASGSLLVLNFNSHQLLMNFGHPLIGCCDCHVLFLIIRAVFNGVRKWPFTSLCQRSRKLAPSSQPIKCKTKFNPNLVTRVFLRFKEGACFYFEFWLVDDDVKLCSDS